MMPTFCIKIPTDCAGVTGNRKKFVNNKMGAEYEEKKECPGPWFTVVAVNQVYILLSPLLSRRTLPLRRQNCIWYYETPKLFSFLSSFNSGRAYLTCWVECTLRYALSLVYPTFKQILVNKAFHVEITILSEHQRTRSNRLSSLFIFIKQYRQVRYGVHIFSKSDYGFKLAI